MRIDIFDVGHGQCACITTPNGRRILIDCGDRLEPNWWPSVHFIGHNPDVLVVTNLDEDHISDFEGLQGSAPPTLIVTNPTIGAAALAAMKPDGMSRGTRAFHRWLSGAAGGPLIPFPDFGGVTIARFHNSYGADFTDTNNLSLVTFVSYGEFAIAFTGDIECAGWSRLLAMQPQIRECLHSTTVFVTSHHGRDSGCSDEVFNTCNPQLFVMSDAVIEHDTQETANWYRNRASGARVTRRATARGLMSALPIFQEAPETRYVVSTRNDKSMRIQVAPDGVWTCEIGIDHTYRE